MFYRLSFFILLISQLVFANPADILKQVDKKRYSPKSLGIKDLYFEVRFPYLLDELNQKLIYGKLEDVYFRVYWMYPGRTFIEVVGMPKGFKKVKESLKNLVRAQIPFVIPNSLYREMKQYTLSQQFSKKSGLIITGKDSNYRTNFFEVLVYINRRNQVTKIIGKKPTGTQFVTYRYSKESWAQGLAVPDKIVTRVIEGTQSTESAKTLTYAKVGNFGFPIKIANKTSQKLLQPSAKKSETYNRSFSSEVNLGSYKVNTGIPQKKLTKSQ